MPRSFAVQPLEIEHVRQILVFRPNAVGDFVFALPCLCSLRAAYPSARIVYGGVHPTYFWREILAAEPWVGTFGGAGHDHQEN